MSTPPRRSRPRKPGETIDSTAERLSGEPLTPLTADAPGTERADGETVDPEARLDAQASDVSEQEPKTDASPLPGIEAAGVSVLGEAREDDRDAPPPAEEAPRDETAAAAAVDPVPPDAEHTAIGNEAAARAGETDTSESGERRTGAESVDAETVLGDGSPHAAEPSPAELNYHHTPADATPPHGAGFGSLVGAGLVGAALALLVGGALQYAGVVPAVREPNTDQLAQQFARTGDVQQLSTDLATVRGTVEQLQSAVSAGGASGPSGADFAALSDRFNNLEGRVNGLAGGAQAQPNAAPAVDPAVLQGVTDAANGARQAAEGAQGRADEARQTAQTAQQAAGTAQQAASVAQQAADGAMQTARANGEAIEDIRNRIGSVEAANRRASVAIAAAGLKAAVDRGGPFMTELETFATASGPAPVVEALRNYAAEGVPATRQLQDDWPNVRTAVLQALRPRDPDAGVGQQILSGLNSLVAVRPSAQAGASGAAGPDATVARLDAAIEAGNLDEWNREWQSLPQAGKDAGADFARRVAARAEAERVVGEALAGAVSQTGTAN